MNTLRNLALALCLGSVVAILLNMGMDTAPKFSSKALTIGVFVAAGVFVVRPIREKENRSKPV